MILQLLERNMFMITSQQSIKIDPKQLTQKLLDLDKKAQELDEVLKDVRVAVNDVLWDLVEMKTDKK